MCGAGTYSLTELQDLVRRLTRVQGPIFESNFFLNVLQPPLGLWELVGLIAKQRDTNDDSFVFDFIICEPHLVL